MLEPKNWRAVFQLSAFLCLLLINVPQSFAVVYIKSVDFINNNFDSKPALKTIWIKAEQQAVAKDILGHPYRGLRVRYWQLGEKSAWILEEIGKVKPITVGIIINESQIEKLSILAFRESRGGEVRHPFFTKQFYNVLLTDKQNLDRNIDGIAGATLSVRAVTKLSRYALYLESLL